MHGYRLSLSNKVSSWQLVAELYRMGDAKSVAYLLFRGWGQENIYFVCEKF